MCLVCGAAAAVLWLWWCASECAAVLLLCCAAAVSWCGGTKVSIIPLVQRDELVSQRDIGSFQVSDRLNNCLEAHIF